MAVAFDAVGPSAAGAYLTTNAVSWSHTNSAAGNAIVVSFSFPGASTSSVTAVSYGAAALTRIGQQSFGQGGTDVWGKVGGLPTGANTVTVTGMTNASTTTGVAGGSTSYTAAVSFGTAFVAAVNSTSISVNVTGTTAGGMICASDTFGSNVTPTPSTGGTLRVNAQGDSGSGADNCFIGTWVSPGGTQAVGFSTASADNHQIVAVELLPSGAAAALLPQQVRHRAPQAAPYRPGLATYIR